MDIQLILVDRFDKPIGYSNYDECHIGEGKHHRAFVTLLFDKDNNVILQKRKHRLFDGFWDLTAISHPLHLSGRDESYQEASDRALLKEMGIASVPIEKIGAFNYFAQDGKNCENEYCVILVGNFDGQFKPNKSEVYEVKKVKFEEFIEDSRKNSKNYTPWSILSAQVLKKVSPNLFKSELSKFLASYEPYEKAYFAKKIKETSKYSPQIAELYRQLASFSTGGKRMRAYLVWLSYQVAGGRDLNKILPISLALEMTQNFLLIHDDVMDNSELRRGGLTIHKIYEKRFGVHYGESMAILLGDIACLEVFDIIASSSFSDEVKVRIQKIFSQTILETAYGQALDLEYGFKKPTFGQIMQVDDSKNSYSIVGPLEVGAALGVMKNSQLSALKTCGAFLGRAYQLVDDILGVFGDERVLGKSTLSDIQEGKNTLLIYKAKQLANGKDRLFLEKVWGKSNVSFKDLEKVKEIIEKCGALEWCRQENRRLVTKAKREVEKITNESNLQAIFYQIADFVISREK